MRKRASAKTKVLKKFYIEDKEKAINNNEQVTLTILYRAAHWLNKS